MPFAANVHPCDDLSIGAEAIIAENTKAPGPMRPQNAAERLDQVVERYQTPAAPTADEWGLDSHDPFYPHGGSLLQLATDTAARIGAGSARHLEGYYLGRLLPTMTATTAYDLHRRSVLTWLRSPSSSVADTRSP